jgi:hypothetical protein
MEAFWMLAALVVPIALIGLAVRERNKPNNTQDMCEKNSDVVRSNKLKNFTSNPYFQQTLKWCVVIVVASISIKYLILPGIPTELKLIFDFANKTYQPIEIEIRNR